MNTSTLNGARCIYASMALVQSLIGSAREFLRHCILNPSLLAADPALPPRDEVGSSAGATAITALSPLDYCFFRRFALLAPPLSHLPVLLEDLLRTAVITETPCRAAWVAALVRSTEEQAGGPPPLPNLLLSDEWAALKYAIAGYTPRGVAPVIPYALLEPVTAWCAYALSEALPAFLCSPFGRARERFLARLGGAEGALQRYLAAPPALGEFEKLGVVGSGSYGSVFAWRHALTGALFAVKECSKATLKAKNSVHTALREISCTMPLLGDPGIATFAWVLDGPGHMYFAQPFRARGDLERWLLASPQKRFSERTVQGYAAQLALSLRSLHAQGILHRDVKASNVLMDSCVFTRAREEPEPPTQQNRPTSAPANHAVRAT